MNVSTSMNAVRSEFERNWESVGHGRSVAVSRQLGLDGKAYLEFPFDIYTPFSIQQLNADFAPPDAAWVSKELIQLVRGVGEARLKMTKQPEANFDSQTKLWRDLDWNGVLTWVNDFVVFGKEARSIYRSAASADTMMHRLLCLPRLGSKNEENITPEMLGPAVQHSASEGVPIYVILPAFPFKDQNPLRTEAPAWHVDLSEVLMLVRLYAIAAAVKQIHPQGMEWIIASDGRIYSEIFGVSEKEALRYRENLRSYRNTLNLQKFIHVVDIQEMIAGLKGFGEINRTIRFTLAEVIKGDPKVNEHFESLTHRIKLNLNLRDYVVKHDKRVLQSCLDENVGTDSLTTEEQQIREEIRQRADHASLEYASINLAIKYTKLLQRFFPNSLRATIHPKAGQIGIAAGKGRVYPWNGVAIMRSERLSPQNVWNKTDVQYVSRVEQIANGKILYRVMSEEGAAPFVYMVP